MKAKEQYETAILSCNDITIIFCATAYIKELEKEVESLQAKIDELEYQGQLQWDTHQMCQTINLNKIRALKAERANMTKTHAMNMRLRAEDFKLLQEELSCYKQYTLSEPKTCKTCKHHCESDGSWGICSYIDSWLYLEETPVHATCICYKSKEQQ